jgi:hypothetical protein
MMERLGIDPGGGVVSRLGLQYAAALRRCESCPVTQVCKTWLEGAPESAGIAPPFCPNGDILFELQFDQPWIKINRPMT